MFKWIGAVAGIFLGSSMGVAGFGGAINGWWVFGLMGAAIGAWIDNSLIEEQIASQGEKPDYTVLKMPNYSNFLEAKRRWEKGSSESGDSDYIEYVVGWVMGYISGVNGERVDHTGVSSRLGEDQSTDEIEDWLVNYRRNHPKEDVADATQVLVEELTNGTFTRKSGFTAE